MLWILGLVLASAAGAASVKSGWGEVCDLTHNRLDPATWMLVTDCDPQTYCASNGTCAYRGCRRDMYPRGYNGVPFDELPPLCAAGYFCPDESDRCLPQAEVGGVCQKDRDDGCAPAPDYKLWASYLNINGSVCLNFTCHYANVGIGQTCVSDNTMYQATTDDGLTTFAYIISRDNCGKGMYCDGSSLMCLKQKHKNQGCKGNKECLSYNCNDDHVCDTAADEPWRPGTWTFAVVGVAILLVIVGVMTGLWFMHRKSRNENQLRLEQYYNEQLMYRKGIKSMDLTTASLLALPPNTTPQQARMSLYDDRRLSTLSGTPPRSHGAGTRGYSSASLLPPNMQREPSSGGWSDDSDQALIGEGTRHGRGSGQHGAGRQPSGGRGALPPRRPFRFTTSPELLREEVEVDEFGSLVAPASKVADGDEAVPRS